MEKCNWGEGKKGSTFKNTQLDLGAFSVEVFFVLKKQFCLPPPHGIIRISFGLRSEFLQADPEPENSGGSNFD